ncbi:hypothetical protein [Haloplanus sp.]|uniref:hypothetical protein n=1 Tax=Haloplanus sp. TaxID=1961696 RepID=UPI0026021E5A|nr:hypothetical protein [Haloplanus sp.]
MTTGTGAFTSVTADRDVSVAVADDTDAFLRIEQVPGSPNSQQHVTQTDGELAIDVSGSGNGGSGVNIDGVTVFRDLFQVGNQGTQAVDVQVTPLSLVEASGANTTLVVLVVPQTDFPKVRVDTGETERYDMVVAATDDAVDATKLSDTISVVAEAP